MAEDAATLEVTNTDFSLRSAHNASIEGRRRSGPDTAIFALSVFSRQIAGMREVVEELRFAVEEGTDDNQHVAEVLARACYFSVASAAFDAALKTRPGRIVLLRHGTRVIRDRRPD